MFKPTTNMHRTSKFGWRKLEGIEKFHSGIDYGYRKELGDPILAVEDGIIRKAQVGTGYGNYIVIEHDGWCSLYAHLKSMNVTVGQKVLKYQTIAEMGSTGHVTGKHLHFEIRDVPYNLFWERYDNDEWIHCVDPEKFYLEREVA